MKTCIVYISSRTKCIELSLKSLWDHFNHKYDYPVKVFYFDDIYDNVKIETYNQNVEFKKVDYKIPEHIEETDLYYHKHYLSYVRSSFPKSRLGYLHMCNFNSNLYGYSGTNLEIYDYIITHDDESGYNKIVDFDPIQILKDSGNKIGAFFVGKRLKNGHPHQGHLDTRIGLFDFTKRFVESNKIDVSSGHLQEVLLKNDPYLFHFLDWCDTYVIDTSVFDTNIWKLWINEVNKSGGIYKYRWGDNEIISIFAHIIQSEITEIPVVSDGYHDQGKFRHIQDIAPGVLK